MRRNKLPLILSLILTLGAFPAFADEAVSAHATLLDNAGKETGQVSFTQGATGVLMHVEVAGLAPGKHGLHLHAMGDCSDHDHFKKAGGHLMRPGETHGILSSKPHAGDFPNLFIGKDGSASADFFNPDISLSDANKGVPLLDKDGAAVMIHKDADDYMTDPTGNSGDRIACGVIQ